MEKCIGLCLRIVGRGLRMMFEDQWKGTSGRGLRVMFEDRLMSVAGDV